MKRYSANPTVISIERGTFVGAIKFLLATVNCGLQIKFILAFHVPNYVDSNRAWNGSIPTLTFSYHNRYDETKAKRLIQRLWNIDALYSEYSYFLDYVEAVVNTSIASFHDAQSVR